jgi:single-strand DNA-binding protein
MALYLNSVHIAGYLVSTPDIKPTKEGLPRSKFTVALNRPNKGSPEYIRCVAWGEYAMSITKYATKGQEIIISGALETTTWQDRNQMKHTTTEVIVDKFNLGSKPRSKPNVAEVRKPTSPIARE